MGDDPAYLHVGTEVSAKYKGAFCEAKIKKVLKNVKCKVQCKNETDAVTVSDEQIKGALTVGASVEIQKSEKKDNIEGTIVKIQDLSQYTVVFDDGDIATLRRPSLCLKSGRYFADCPTLDHLPLTNPERFCTPVPTSSSKNRNKRRRTDDSSDEEFSHLYKCKVEKEKDIGKVVCVELSDKRKAKDNWFPALIVAPNAQSSVKINPDEEYLVRSFKDGRYYTVPKKETTEFTRQVGFKVENPTLKAAVEKAISFLDNDDLPPHWDRDVLFGMIEYSSSDDSDTDTSNDEPREEKDRFVAQLYKFMDDSGTPINKEPVIDSKDVDMYRLFSVVNKLGGYNRATNRNLWKFISVKLGFGPDHTKSVKSTYKQYLHSFEDFYRKLGCTLLAKTKHIVPRNHYSRPLIRDRDKSFVARSTRNKNKSHSALFPRDASVNSIRTFTTEDSSSPVASPIEFSGCSSPANPLNNTPTVETDSQKPADKCKRDKTATNIVCESSGVIAEKDLDRIKVAYEETINTVVAASVNDVSDNASSKTGQKNRIVASNTSSDPYGDPPILKDETKWASDRSVLSNKLIPGLRDLAEDSKLNERKEVKLKSSDKDDSEVETIDTASKNTKSANIPKSRNRNTKPRPTDDNSKYSILFRKRKRKLESPEDSGIPTKKMDRALPKPDENLHNSETDKSEKNSCLSNRITDKDVSELTLQHPSVSNMGNAEEPADLPGSKQSKTMKERVLAIFDKLKMNRRMGLSENKNPKQPVMDKEPSKAIAVVNKTPQLDIDSDISSKAGASVSDSSNSNKDDNGSKQKLLSKNRKDISDKSVKNPAVNIISANRIIRVGDRLKVYYGPTNKPKVAYEAKVTTVKMVGGEKQYLVHYTGWNTRYDEWITRNHIADNLSRSSIGGRKKSIIGHDNKVHPSGSSTMEQSSDNEDMKNRDGQSASPAELCITNEKTKIRSVDRSTRSSTNKQRDITALSSNRQLSPFRSVTRSRKMSSATDISDASTSNTDVTISKSKSDIESIQSGEKEVMQKKRKREIKFVNRNKNTNATSGRNFQRKSDKDQNSSVSRNIGKNNTRVSAFRRKFANLRRTRSMALLRVHKHENTTDNLKKRKIKERNDKKELIKDKIDNDKLKKNCIRSPLLISEDSADKIEYTNEECDIDEIIFDHTNNHDEPFDDINVFKIPQNIRTPSFRKVERQVKGNENPAGLGNKVQNLSENQKISRDKSSSVTVVPKPEELTSQIDSKTNIITLENQLQTRHTYEKSVIPPATTGVLKSDNSKSIHSGAEKKVDSPMKETESAHIIESYLVDSKPRIVRTKLKNAEEKVSIPSRVSKGYEQKPEVKTDAKVKDEPVCKNISILNSYLNIDRLDHSKKLSPIKESIVEHKQEKEGIIFKQKSPVQNQSKKIEVKGLSPNSTKIADFNDIYEFKEPEPLEYEKIPKCLETNKIQRRTLGRIFDDNVASNLKTSINDEDKNVDSVEKNMDIVTKVDSVVSNVSSISMDVIGDGVDKIASPETNCNQQSSAILATYLSEPFKRVSSHSTINSNKIKKPTNVEKNTIDKKEGEKANTDSCYIVKCDSAPDGGIVMLVQTADESCEGEIDIVETTNQNLRSKNDSGKDDSEQASINVTLDDFECSVSAEGTKTLASKLSDINSLLTNNIRTVSHVALDIKENTIDEDCLAVIGVDLSKDNNKTELKDIGNPKSNVCALTTETADSATNTRDSQTDVKSYDQNISISSAEKKNVEDKKLSISPKENIKRKKQALSKEFIDSDTESSNSDDVKLIFDEINANTDSASNEDSILPTTKLTNQSFTPSVISHSSSSSASSSSSSCLPTSSSASLSSSRCSSPAQGDLEDDNDETEQFYDKDKENVDEDVNLAADPTLTIQESVSKSDDSLSAVSHLSSTSQVMSDNPNADSIFRTKVSGTEPITDKDAQKSSSSDDDTASIEDRDEHEMNTDSSSSDEENPDDNFHKLSTGNGDSDAFCANDDSSDSIDTDTDTDTDNEDPDDNDDKSSSSDTDDYDDNRSETHEVEYDLESNKNDSDYDEADCLNKSKLKNGDESSGLENKEIRSSEKCSTAMEHKKYKNVDDEFHKGKSNMEVQDNKDLEDDSELGNNLLCEETLPGSPVPTMDDESESADFKTMESEVSKMFEKSVSKGRRHKLQLHSNIYSTSKKTTYSDFHNASKTMYNRSTLENTPPSTPEEGCSPLHVHSQYYSSSPVFLTSGKSRLRSMYVDEDAEAKNYSNRNLYEYLKRKRNLNEQNLPTSYSNFSSFDSNYDPSMEIDDTAFNELDLSFMEREPIISSDEIPYFSEMDPNWDADEKIAFWESKLKELRESYSELKHKVIKIDKKRRQLRRKKREQERLARLNAESGDTNMNSDNDDFDDNKDSNINDNSTIGNNDGENGKDVIGGGNNDISDSNDGNNTSSNNINNNEELGGKIDNSNEIDVDNSNYNVDNQEFVNDSDEYTNNDIHIAKNNNDNFDITTSNNSNNNIEYTDTGGVDTDHRTDRNIANNKIDNSSRENP